MAKNVKVEIRADGWAGYSGPLGGYIFKDGFSTGEIPIRAALRIGASIEAYDENGVRLHPSSYVVNDSPGSIGASLVNYPMGEDQPVPAYVPETTKEEAKAIDLTPVREMVAGRIKETYSRLQLEAIADKKGIEGLREIADKHDLKGRSVAELIEKILGAQA